jgi:hypothetical protein
MLAACRHVSKADIWPHALLDDGRPRASPIHGPEKCPNLGPSLSVGDDDAIPSKKICPCPGTHWACHGWSGKRIVCCRPCGVKHRSVRVPRFYNHDDDWWRSWILPGNRYSGSGFSSTIWSAFKRRLQWQGRFCRIPQRRRDVSRYIDGFCLGHRYRVS